MRSPVCPQPEPRTSATSWLSMPVRSRITAAAASATAKGSVAGSARSREAEGEALSVTRAGYPPRGWMEPVNARTTRVVIVGGGPGGYEAALVAAHLGGEVTIIDRDGLGGAAVLTDCVPSKTLISTADYMSEFETAAHLGVHLEDGEGDAVSDAKAELAEVNSRVKDLAAAQSRDIGERVAEVGVRVLRGTGQPAVRRPRSRPPSRDGGTETRRCRRRPPRDRRHPSHDGHRRSPTASASSPGSRSTSSTPSPSGSSSWDPVSPAPSWPRPTSGSAPTSSSCPRVTGSCRARTRTRPPSSRTSSGVVAWRSSDAPAWLPSSAAVTVSSSGSRTVARSRARTRCWPSAPSRRPPAWGSRRSVSSSRRPATSRSTASRARP